LLIDKKRENGKRERKEKRKKIKYVETTLTKWSEK
jgi:hypothetical protein